MSLLGKITKAVKKVANIATVLNPALGGGTTDINRAMGQALGIPAGFPGMTGGPVAGGALPSASFLPQVVAGGVALGKQILSTKTGKAAVVTGGVAVADAALDFFGGDDGGGRRRRMNPLNVRAARRAIRRIKAVRKITASIEKSLPKAKARGGHQHFVRHRR